MGKVSKDTIRIAMFGSLHAFEVDIEYDNKAQPENAFFIRLNEGLTDAYRAIPGMFQKDIPAEISYVRGSQTVMVRDETPEKVKRKFEAAVASIRDKGFVDKPVIVVFWNKEKGYKASHNKDHPFVGGSLALKYCIERSLGEEKSYGEMRPSSFGRAGLEWQSLTIWDDAHMSKVILPDNVENRQLLENLYGAMKVLTEKLSELTESEEKLLSAISSGKNLLS